MTMVIEEQKKNRKKWEKGKKRVRGERESSRVEEREKKGKKIKIRNYKIDFLFLKTLNFLFLYFK